MVIMISLNRTRVELKHDVRGRRRGAPGRLNRTRVELKHQERRDDDLRGRVLIEPEWN